MGAEEVCRYLELLDRRLYIVTHSGIDWKPEYGSELAAVDRELAGLRKLIDQEHERRGRGW